MEVPHKLLALRLLFAANMVFRRHTIIQEHSVVPCNFFSESKEHGGGAVWLAQT